jgi:hypothetical protein
MKVEMKADWADLPKKAKPQTSDRHQEPPRSRAERKLWYIAVGREIETDVDSGRFSSLADAARACQVSKSRVSQLVE